MVFWFLNISFLDAFKSQYSTTNPYNSCNFTVSYIHHHVGKHGSPESEYKIKSKLDNKNMFLLLADGAKHAIASLKSGATKK